MKQKKAEMLLRQEKAKGFIFDNLETTQFEKVSRCLTVRQVLVKLDGEFQSKSQIGLISAREEYHSLKFHLKGDMAKFLEIFDMKCQNFIDAGGNVDDLEKIRQLSSALPFSYDSVLEWYDGLPNDSPLRTFEQYRNKVLEKWRRFKRSTSGHEENKSHDQQNKNKHKDPGNHSNDLGNCDRKSDNDKNKTYCRYCHSRQHILTDCEKLKKKNKDDNSSAESRRDEKKDSVPKRQILSIG